MNKADRNKVLTTYTHFLNIYT